MSDSWNDKWKQCSRCSQIGSAHSEDRIKDEGPGLPQAVFELPGMSEENLSSGYKAWTVECDLCGTRYLAEVDVEPFVWDVSIAREKDGVAMDQFGNVQVLRELPKKR